MGTSVSSFQIAIGVFVSFATLIISTILSTLRSFDYKNKHVMVTGGSSGIGLELAKEYLKRGAKVTIVARDRQRLDLAENELIQIASTTIGIDRVLTVSLDTASSPGNVRNVLANSLKEFGDVDVLVNCAGTSIAGEFDALDDKEFEKMLKINVLGSIYPTRAVLPGMKKKGKGRIVFVSSQVAQVAIHGYTAYGASKWALRGLAEALQMEVKPFGIYVSVAYPPDTDTPGYKTEMETKPALTKRISESGQVFSPATVAKDIIFYSGRGYFGISTGLDGWLLKQLHPGMSPVNTWAETWQQIFIASFARIIAVFYVLSWDAEVAKTEKKEVK